MKQKLNDEDIRTAALALECEEAAVRAVLAVESSGRGFAADGRPVILFEGHVFYRQLERRGLGPERHMREYPSVVYPVWTRAYYGGQRQEWRRLEAARSIHEEAALSSASWGLFQILGCNHALCGFGGVSAFVEAMHKGEAEHLAAFVSFIRRRGLAVHLARCDWKSFAAGYNGPGYAVNKYDAKLAAAYARARGKQ